MTAKTMTARYAGTCRRCRCSITPGDEILFLGKRRTVHANCAETGRVIECYSPVTGNSWTVNRNGRCEDAPCCGCCT